MGERACLFVSFLKWFISWCVCGVRVRVVSLRFVLFFSGFWLLWMAFYLLCLSFFVGLVWFVLFCFVLFCFVSFFGSWVLGFGFGSVGEVMGR